MYEALASILVYVFNEEESTIQTGLQSMPRINWTDQPSH
jgi:hypothetical protein